MKFALPLLFSPFLFFHTNAQKPRAKHTVFFNLDSYAISEAEQELLNLWLQRFSEDTILKLGVIGHTDFLGSLVYNQYLSEKRAASVIAFIEKNRLINYRVSLVSAEGEKFANPASRSKNGNAKDRKVEVSIFLKNAKSNVFGVENLEQTEVGKSIVLKELNFIGGRHFLLPEAKPELERLIKIMQKNPALKVEIQGHICCKFDSLDGLDLNTRTYELSLNRAKYIREQLMLAGIDSLQIKCRGFGSTRPLVYPEKTSADQTRNRRVEIMVLKK